MNWCHNQFKSEYFRIPKATKWKVAPKKAKKQKKKTKNNTIYWYVCRIFWSLLFSFLNELRYYLFHRASSYVNNFIQFLPSFLSSFSFFFVFFFQTVSRINVIFQLWRKKKYFYFWHLENKCIYSLSIVFFAKSLKWFASLSHTKKLRATHVSFQRNNIHSFVSSMAASCNH